MSHKIYTATLSTIIRSPVTWISLCAVLVLFAQFISKEIAETTTYNFHESLAGYALSVLELSVPIFIAVVAAADIQRDVKNRFKDITDISGTAQHRIYCSKICAYLSIGLVLSFVLTFAFFFIRFFQLDMLRGIDYTLPECLCLLSVRWIAYSLPVLLVYTALSVCVSLVCRSTVAGIVVPIAYAFARYPIIGLRLENFVSDYIYHIPRKIQIFFYFQGTRARPEAVVDIAVPEVLLSYALVAAISGVLLCVGYVMYKRRTD